MAGADVLRHRLRSDLTEAMRMGERDRIALIRSLLSALSNAEAVDSPHGSEPVPFGTAEAVRRELTTADAIAILERERGERSSVLADYRRHDDPSHAVRLQAEIDLLDRYLGLIATV